MATCLFSLVSLATLAQAPTSGGPPAPPAPPPAAALSDTIAAELRGRIAKDSTDGVAWLELGRLYVRTAEAAHRAPHRASDDTVAARAVLDTAEQLLARAVQLLGAAGSTPAGDSARVLRVGVWSVRSRLAWEERGLAVGPQEWGPVPLDLKLPPVLDELGENLLRACPMWGVLLTGREADSDAAWYMRYARGLRPDLLIVPLAAWRADSALRSRLVADLRLARHYGGDALLGDLARHRPVCLSMAFERPPEPTPRIGWTTRPLVWVAGPHLKDDRVPARDFVFAALRVALDGQETWAQPALALYVRAARATPALCEAMRTFKVTDAIPGCRR